MAWNEPGGGRDPWGGNRGGDGPPDIDEVVKKLKEKFGFFGGGKDGNEGGPSSKFAVCRPSCVAYNLELMGFYQVDEKEEAVVLRLGKYHDTRGSGLKWNPPIIDSVTSGWRD